MSNTRRFKQVDVFTGIPFKGNPLAVVLDAEGLTDECMQEIARWTNLSETTFALPATDPAADYRVRIFTLDSELPFAGHPTLGTAHALLESGLKPKSPSRIVQQCGVGLVPIDIAGDGTLAFRAPAAQHQAFDPAALSMLESALKSNALKRGALPVTVDMGVKWLTVRMENAEACLAVRPDGAAMIDLIRRCGINGVAIYGSHEKDGVADYEVRALFTTHGMLAEDPVTGSANACIARVLQAQGFPDGVQTSQRYSVRQGTALHRDGRLSVEFMDGEPWIGGQSVTVVDGLLQT
jgi:PhzF family phenazine biosynthesis protein